MPIILNDCFLGFSIVSVFFYSIIFDCFSMSCFDISGLSESFFQCVLWHSGQRNSVVSIPSPYSSGMRKLDPQFIQ